VVKTVEKGTQPTDPHPRESGRGERPNPGKGIFLLHCFDSVKIKRGRKDQKKAKKREKEKRSKISRGKIFPAKRRTLT